MPDWPAVVEDAFESAPVEEPKVALAAERGNGSPFIVTRDPPRWKGRVVDEHDPRSVGNGRLQSPQIEPPLTVDDPKRDESRRRTDQPHAVEHARVGWIGQDDLVPGVRQAEERIEHRVALAAGDHNLPTTVVTWPAVSLDIGGHRLLEIIPARERQPAVRLVLADGGSGCCHGGFRRR